MRATTFCITQGVAHRTSSFLFFSIEAILKPFTSMSFTDKTGTSIEKLNCHFRLWLTVLSIIFLHGTVKWLSHSLPNVFPSFTVGENFEYECRLSTGGYGALFVGLASVGLNHQQQVDNTVKLLWHIFCPHMKCLSLLRKIWNQVVSIANSACLWSREWCALHTLTCWNNINLWDAAPNAMAPGLRTPDMNSYALPCYVLQKHWIPIPPPSKWEIWKKPPPCWQILYIYPCRCLSICDRENWRLTTLHLHCRKKSIVELRVNADGLSHFTIFNDGVVSITSVVLLIYVR